MPSALALPSTFSEDLDARQLAAIDGVVPAFVASPTTDDEAAQVLRHANHEGLRVAIRGSGSTQGWGRIVTEFDVSLDTRGMNGVADYQADDLVLRARAGTTLGELAKMLRPHGQRLPFDPFGSDGRTLGGVVATNAAGLLRRRFGTPRDSVLGARFLRSDGTSLWSGSNVVKSVTGYNLHKLLAGSFGTLGLITEVSLRVQPVPAASNSLVLGFGTRTRALRFLEQTRSWSLEPERCVLLNRAAAIHVGVNTGGGAVALTIAGSPGAVARTLEQARRAAADLDATWDEPGERLWDRVRSALHGATVLRIGARLADVETFAERAEAQCGPGVSMRLAADPGAGWIHAVLPPTRAAAVGETVTKVRRAATDFGAMVEVESAPAEVRRLVPASDLLGEAESRLMDRVKQYFDPKGILQDARFAGGA